jgi:membrane-bound lytic murein transglycosylase B
MTRPQHRRTRLLSTLMLSVCALALSAPPLLLAAPAKPHKKVAKKDTPKIPARKTDYVGAETDFLAWPAGEAFVDDMVKLHGFARADVETLLRSLRLVDSAVQLVKPMPPGKPKNWQAYSKLFIEPVRIEAGVQFWHTHAEALARAEAQYGVPADIIVGIIGVETVYGRNTGRFRVADVLATLAFAYPDLPNREARMRFFRAELENTMLLARKTGIDPLSLLGSFAGAVGLPQFMPSNILAYGVDFDGDGVIDLRNSAVDAIGSVANFLVQHGWQRQQGAPFAYAATVSPNRAWESLIGRGLAATLKEEELLGAGVSSAQVLPVGSLFGLIDLQNGADPTEYWIATNNFFTITQYNRSYFYAMSVIELGRAVRQGRAAALGI